MKSIRLMRVEAAKIWAAALKAVDAQAAVRKILRRQGNILKVNGGRFDLQQARKVWVLGAGKAVPAMGMAVERILGKYLAGGFLVTKYGHKLALGKIEIMEAGHPLPDKNSAEAAARMAAFVQNRMEEDDLVLCLFSGGASSLLVSPASGITLNDKVACTRILQNAGADIYELNAVRKHLSALKGGGLLRLLAPRPVLCLVLSDVVGDDVATIASGPTAPDPTTFADCLEIFEKLDIWNQIPSAVRKRFELGAGGKIPETPKAGNPIFQCCTNIVVANNAQACAAAARAARRMGYHSMVLTSRLNGDNREAARLHMNIVEEIIFQSRPLRRPACLISGGETTIKVTGKGKGGRNQEFVLNCVRHLARVPAPCLVVSVGTDGTDGPTDAAGALADNTTLMRSLRFGSRFLTDALKNNDSYAFFKRLGDLIITGPTRTNVMDLHIVLIG